MIVSIRFGVENSAGVKVERSLPLSQYLPASARPPPSGSAVTARFIKTDGGICGEVAGCEKNSRSDQVVCRQRRTEFSVWESRV